MERAGPFIDVKLNLPQQRQSGFPPALQTDPYFNLSLRRSIDCCHATPPQELPGWGKVELPHCTPSASCILLELKRGPAHPAPPLQNQTPFPQTAWSVGVAVAEVGPCALQESPGRRSQQVLTLTKCEEEDSQRQRKLCTRAHRQEARIRGGPSRLFNWT